MLTARVCDPAGPRWWRIATGIGLLPLALVGLVLPAPALPRIVTMLAGIAWLVVGRIVVPRPRPRACTVEVEPGAVTIREAGVLSQRVAARDVRGATTALLGDKVTVGIVRGAEGDSPLWLELDSQQDAERVRRALGVGHAGLGVVRYPPSSGIAHSLPTAADYLVGAGWVATLVATCLNADVALPLGVFVTLWTLAALAYASLQRRAPLTLSRVGMQIPFVGFGSGPFVEVRWDEVLGADGSGEDLVVTTAAREYRVPMRGTQPLEREHVAAQIRGAARRARGEGPPPPDVPASLAVLAPRDEAHRAWLERVDATAASLARADGYRDLGVDEGDLWTALESPDAPVPLRSAAARVLARVAPEKAGPRIAEVLAREHDAGARDRIRVVLEEDVDVAARQLERLDRT